MGKYKVGRGFAIASFVVSCVALFGVLISLLGVSAITDSVIKPMLIEAGGSTEYGGSALSYLMTHITELEAIPDSVDFDQLTIASLEVMYVAFEFVVEILGIALICTIAGFVLTLIAMIKSKNATSKKDLTVPMILSFVSVLFEGVFSLVAGILFACVNDNDFKVVE